MHLLRQGNALTLSSQQQSTRACQKRSLPHDCRVCKHRVLAHVHEGDRSPALFIRNEHPTHFTAASQQQLWSILKVCIILHTKPHIRDQTLVKLEIDQSPRVLSHTGLHSCRGMGECGCSPCVFGKLVPVSLPSILYLFQVLMLGWRSS